MAILWGISLLKFQDFTFVLWSSILCYAYIDFCLLEKFFFQGTKFSTHDALGVKNGKWSQIMQ